MGEKDIEKMKAVARNIAQQYKLILVVLFGSQATGHTHPQSDIDIAVLGERLIPLADLARIGYCLEKTFRSKTVEVVDLKTAPPLLLKAAATEGIPLYEQTPHLLAEFQMRALRHYFDTKPLRRLQEASLREYLQTQ